MKRKLKRIWNKAWSWIKPYLTPKMIPIILMIWLMTNGVWYFFAFAPIGVPWLSSFAKGYLVFLYLPWAPEKIIIIFIAGKVYKLIYKEKFTELKIQES